MSRLALALLLLACASPVVAEEYAAIVHCRHVVLDPEGFVRVECPMELDPYAVRTVYVWFDREIPPGVRVDWEVNFAAWPIIVNPIRANASTRKRTYVKFRVANPWAVEQMAMLVWVIPSE